MKLRLLLLPLLAFVCDLSFAADEPPTQKAAPAAAPRWPADLKITHDVVFKEVAGTKLDFTLFSPLEMPFEQSPLVVYIHGGGFGGGDKSKVLRRDVIGVVRALNRRGITCASIEYRLANGGAATVNESVADCKDAVRFFVKNAARYRIDPERIGVFGSSAGGLLTLVTALGKDRDYPCDPAFDGPPGTIRCAAAYYAPVSFVHPELALGSNFENPRRFLPMLGGPLEEKRELAGKLSPVELLRADSPPLFLAHGDTDAVISSRNATFLSDSAKRLGVPVECVIVRGAGHGFGGEAIDPSIDEINRRTLAFFLQHLIAP